MASGSWYIDLSAYIPILVETAFADTHDDFTEILSRVSFP